MVDRGLLSIAEVVAQPNVTFGEVLVREALLALMLLAPMTIAFGAAFPFAVAAATRSDETVASDLGVIYAVNTGGAIAGALMAGFLFIPEAGLHGTLRVVTVIGAAGAIALLFFDRRHDTARRTGRAAASPVALAPAALAVAVLAVGIWLPQWDRLLLSSGAYKYASSIQGPDVRTSLTAGELLYYREGASATVAVRRSAGTTSLAIDGKVDASNGGDMLTQRLLAHVPMLLHHNPQQIAIIGLGSGVTLGSALTHPTVTRADVLEISPEVVEASRFFDAENYGAVTDPRTRLIVGDGRTHLSLTSQQYDVIISEPSNPWMAGIASLFTREFFEAAKTRLRPGGILCQWAHTYDISTTDLQSIVATFQSVFPDGTLWLVGDGDVLLIGSDDRMEPKLERVMTNWTRPSVSEDLATVAVTSPGHILSMYVSGGPPLAAWANNAPIQRDTRSALEFSGPQSIFGPSQADNARLLRDLASSHPPPPVVAGARGTTNASEIRDRGLMFLRADAFRPAYEDFVRALALAPDDPLALDGLTRAAAPLRRLPDARALLTRLARSPDHVNAQLALSRLLASEGAYDQAVTIPFGIVQADPDNVSALEQLASILSDVGDAERMRPVIARLRAISPGTEGTHYYSAALLFMEQRFDLAAAEARRAVALNPRHARAQNLLGAALASIGHAEQARTAFQASLIADPRDPATYTNLATLEMQAGNRDLARRYYAEALTIDPAHGAAREGLARVGHPM
jgi:spermidine synthase